MKKTLSIILFFVLILYSFSPSLATNDNIYEQSANILKEAGVLKEMRLEEKLKRQDMVVLISRLYKEEEIAKNHKGKHGFEDIQDKFYDPYIAWSVNKGLIEGFSENTFGYDNFVKVQEFQTVLLRALDFKEEAANWNRVPDIFQSLKLMEGISAKPKDNINRGLMAQMTVNALNHTLRGSSITLAQKLDIVISEPFIVNGTPLVEKNTFKFEGSVSNIELLKLGLKLVSENDKEEIVYDIELDSNGKFVVEISNLKPGKYEYRFISENKMTKIESFTILSPNIDKVEKL